MYLVAQSHKLSEVAVRLRDGGYQTHIVSSAIIASHIFRHLYAYRGVWNNVFK